MKTNGEENIKGKSWEDITVENKPSKAKDAKFEVGQMRIMTIGAISRPSEDAETETCYLPVGGKADEWIDESTVAKMMPLNEDTACFVAGYKAGFKEGWEEAQKKDQEYFMTFVSEMFDKSNPQGDNQESD